MNDTTMPPPPSRTTKQTQQQQQQQAPLRGPRRKVPLKGFGLSDWVNLTRRAKDLAQRKGAPLRRIRLEEVQQHSTLVDGWCILKGKVYNISPYLAYHPGGETILKAVLGKDASTLFDKYHPWVNVDGLIGTLQLGYLDTSATESEEDDNNNSSPAYMQQPTTPDEFAVPAAPVVTKGTKARNMTNSIMPTAPPRDEDQIVEDYKEPWEK